MIIYGLLLSLMVALASGVSRLAAAGAVLFLISDLILGYEFFLSTAEVPCSVLLVTGALPAGPLLIVPRRRAACGDIRAASLEVPGG